MTYLLLTAITVLVVVSFWLACQRLNDAGVIKAQARMIRELDEENTTMLTLWYRLVVSEDREP